MTVGKLIKGMNMVLAVLGGLLVLSAGIWGAFEYSNKFCTVEAYDELEVEVAGVSKALEIEILTRQIRQLQIDYKCYDIVKCQSLMPPGAFALYQELVLKRININSRLGGD